MTGTNNNSSGMFDPYGLNEMLVQYLSNLQGQQPTLANNDFARETKLEVEKSVKDVSKMTEEEIKKAVKQLENLFTSIFGRSSNAHKFFDQFALQMLQVSKQMSMSTTLFSNLSTSAGSLLMQLSKAGNLGFYNLDKKGIDKNLPAQQIMAALLPEMGKKLDSVADKLLAFFGEDRKNYKTKSRQFIEDLVEGLGRSKFVGGAITDLIRLATLFGASWLKNFGPLGKALAVGLVALGPIIGAKIADILLKGLTTGLGNILKSSMLGLGALLRATILSVTNKNLLGLAMQGKTLGGSVVNGLSRGNLALGSFLAAGAVGAMAIDTFKQEGGRNKAAGVALGTGSLALGASGLAALIGGAFASAVLPIALPVAAIATGIGLIVKFWPRITEWFGKILEKLGLIANKDKDRTFKSGGITPFENLNRDYAGEKGASLKSKALWNTLGEKDLAAWEKADKQSAIVNEVGAITNFGQMTQQQAGREMERLRKENPIAWSNLYEYIPFEGVNGKVYGKRSDFGTDLISPDGKGFYMAKGSMERMDKANEALRKMGYSGSMQFTGGIATAGNIKTLQASPHRLTGKGHDSPYGAKFDIGQSSINTIINAQGKKASASIIDKVIRAGWENANIRSEGDHRDVTWIPAWVRTHVRDEKEQKIEAPKKSIAITQNSKITEEDKNPEEISKPQTIGKQSSDNILFDNPLADQIKKLHAMSGSNNDYIDFTGNRDTNTYVKQAVIRLPFYSYEQQR